MSCEVVDCCCGFDRHRNGDLWHSTVDHIGFVMEMTGDKVNETKMTHVLQDSTQIVIDINREVNCLFLLYFKKI